MKKLSYLASILFIISCSTKETSYIREERYAVKNVIRLEPKNVHDEMSPKYKAILDNGDTVSCNRNITVGDTIIFQYINNFKPIYHK